MNRCCTLLLSALVMACLVSSTAPIQAGDYNLDVLYGFGGPYGYYGYGARTGDIPYFALHPPVYYSGPISRPYGITPFACPPLPCDTNPAPPAPQVMINPFVPQSKDPQPAIGRTARVPKRIKNPHVMATVRTTDSRDDGPELPSGSSRAQNKEVDPILTDMLVTWSILPESTKQQIREILRTAK